MLEAGDGTYRSEDLVAHHLHLAFGISEQRRLDVETGSVDLVAAVKESGTLGLARLDIA